MYNMAKENKKNWCTSAAGLPLLQVCTPHSNYALMHLHTLDSALPVKRPATTLPLHVYMAGT